MSFSINQLTTWSVAVWFVDENDQCTINYIEIEFPTIRVESQKQIRSIAI